MAVVNHKSELRAQGQVFKLEDVQEFFKVAPKNGARLRVHESTDYSGGRSSGPVTSHLILEWETIE